VYRCHVAGSRGVKGTSGEGGIQMWKTEIVEVKVVELLYSWTLWNAQIETGVIRGISGFQIYFYSQ
jgi:hypothetical protein